MNGRYRLMIVVLAITAYWPTLRCGFLWDDHVMIENNPTIQSWTIPNIRHDLTTDVFLGQGDKYYRPMQTWMNRLDASVWGMKPFGYHLTNLIFHTANAVLLAEMLIVLGFSSLMAMSAGTLFAVHPIGVEQLMIIAGRAELMGLCFLLMLLWVLAKQPFPARSSSKTGWASIWNEYFFLALALYGAALLTKESTVVTPVVIALLFYMLKRPKKLYWQLVPFVVLTAIYLLWHHHLMGSVLGQGDRRFIPLFFVKAFPWVLLKYAGLILFPWNLHSHRLMPGLHILWPLWLIGGAALAIWAFRRRQRWVLVTLAWYVLHFLPKTPVMIFGNFMLDHWAYPSAAALLSAIAYWLVKGWHSKNQTVQGVSALVYCSMLIGGALLVHLNVALRGTDEQMYRWALHFTTSRPVHYNLGLLLLQSGRADEAVDHFEKVRMSYPDNVDNLHALGLAYYHSRTPGYPRCGYYMLREFSGRFPNHEPLHQSWKTAERLGIPRPSPFRDKKNIK